MLALIGNLDFFEIVLILVVSVVVFGDRLPEVAMKAAAHLVRLRRTVMQMWREAGLEDELRRVQREIDLDVKKLPNPKQYIAQKVEGLVDSEPDEDPPAEGEAGSSGGFDEGLDPDADRALEGYENFIATGGVEGEPHLVVDGPATEGDADTRAEASFDRREPLAESPPATETTDTAEGDDAESPAGREGDASTDEGRETA